MRIKWIVILLIVACIFIPNESFGEHLMKETLEQLNHELDFNRSETKLYAAGMVLQEGQTESVAEALEVSDTVYPIVLIKENFRSVKEGYLPDVWISGDDVGVFKNSNRSYLADISQGEHRILINQKFPKSWNLKWILNYEARFSVNIGDYTIKISKNIIDVTGANRTRLKHKAYGRTSIFQVEKNDAVLIFSINGNRVAMSKLSTMAPPQSIIFDFGDREHFRLYSLELMGGE